MPSMNQHIKKKIIVSLNTIVVLLLITNLSSCKAKQEIEVVDPGKEEYMRAVALFEEGLFYSAKEAFENSEYNDYQQRASDCIQTMPETGELWHDENMISDNMRLDFVANEEDENTGMYIVVYTKDNNLVEKVFIKGSGTVETWIPEGSYYIKDAFGTMWFGEKELFGKDGEYETMLFYEDDEDPYLVSLSKGNIWTITINSTNDLGDHVESEKNEWGTWN